MSRHEERNTHTHTVPEEDGVTQLLDPPNFSEPFGVRLSLDPDHLPPPITCLAAAAAHGDRQRRNLPPLLTHPLTQTN